MISLTNHDSSEDLPRFIDVFHISMPFWWWNPFRSPLVRRWPAFCLLRDPAPAWRRATWWSRCCLGEVAFLEQWWLMIGDGWWLIDAGWRLMIDDDLWSLWDNFGINMGESLDNLGWLMVYLEDEATVHKWLVTTVSIWFIDKWGYHGI